ncbi:MAG: Bug family tripartite tricarboxylate transporter substrate binding protein [bacterium]|jgi:tripartite-type tricarboxylate transporter receptor subunit TctC|nr:tripartite tricarboxylate transporter substrate binding protein [Betaproteobacteria bacterium]
MSAIQGLVHVHPLVILSIALSSGPLLVNAALAQDYPTRTIRIVVAQAPASGPDMVARTLAQKLTEAWGQQVVVENRPGANGIIGGEAVARAKPDGYTLLIGVPSAITMNPFVYRQMPYDPLRDLVPVSQIATNTFGLVVTSSLPASSVKALVALARARPGELLYASAGLANQTHLAGELFASAVGVKMVHVPYKGSTPAWTDLISGQVALMFTSTQGVTGHVKAGKLRLLATLGSKRAAAFPAVPTVVESGYPTVEITGWTGLFAPAATPADVVGKLAKELARALGDADVRERMAADGAEPSPSSPQAFAAFVKAEAAKWSKVIRAAGLENSQ